MTDHYAEAERLVDGLTRDGMTIEDLTVTMAAAQVHATLATVQRGINVGDATVDLDCAFTMPAADDPREWLRITDLTTGNSRLVPAASRTIPWPPSDELVEKVARSMHDQNYNCRDCGGHWMDYVPMTRAVLDVIAGDA